MTSNESSDKGVSELQRCLQKAKVRTAQNSKIVVDETRCNAARKGFDVAESRAVVRTHRTIEEH